MKLLICQPLAHLSVDELPDTGFAVNSLFALINTAAVISEISHDQFVGAAGSLDRDTMAATKTHAICHVQNWPTPMNEHEAGRILHAFNVAAQLFLLALWLVKDNSANALRSYLRFDDDEGDPNFASENFDNWFLTADCKLTETHYTIEELESAIAYSKQFDSVIPRREEGETRVSGLVHDTRIGRTLYVLQAARTTGDLLVKVAFYCMCLESLFSTDKEGISYRVAERTSLFIGKDGPERRAIFEDITKLYGTRSKVVHGEVVTKGQLPDLFERVKRGDAHLRACLRKILGNPAMLELFSAKKNEAIIEHFKAQVFDR